MTMESKMKPAAEASFAPSDEYTKMLIRDGAYVKPTARKPTICHEVSTFSASKIILPLTATWYVCVESEPTTMKTPTMTQNVYAITHHAKLGNVPLTAAMRDETKVMSQASCNEFKVSLISLLDAQMDLAIAEEDIRMLLIVSQARMDRRQYALTMVQLILQNPVTLNIPKLNPRIDPRRPELASRLFMLFSKWGLA